jgi:hypothetical protein
MEIHQNAAAASLILSALKPEELRKVNGMESAKQIWDTLKISYEGDKTVRVGFRELLQSKIENFDPIEGETTQAMFDRFMEQINKIRALGDKTWDDNAVARKLCRVYRQKNNTLATIIMEKDNYDRMTPYEMLAKIMHHEVLEDEAKEAMSRKKSVALKASQGKEKKKISYDTTSEEESSDEEAALLIKKYTRFLRRNKSERKRNGSGNKSRKRYCYGCGSEDHFIAKCPIINEKEKSKKGKYNKDDDKKGKKYKGKKRGEAHIGEEWESSDDSDASSEDDKGRKKGIATFAVHASTPTDTTNDVSPPTLFANLSSSPTLFNNLDNDYYTPTCLMAKGEKVHTSTSYSSDEYNSCDENDLDDELEQCMIKKFGHKASSKILKLLKKLETYEGYLESQGELLLEEKEKNQGLEASLVEEKLKVEKLNIELSLVKDSYERLTKEHSLVNDSLASLKNEHSLAQESLTSLKEKYQTLELNYDTLWKSTSNTSKESGDSNASTSKGCKRCYNIDINACATNRVELEKKDKEIQRLNAIIKSGCNKDKQPPVVYKASRHPSIKDGIGYSKYDGRANGRKMINGVPCVKFNKGVVLDDILNKVNNVVSPPSTLPSIKVNKKKLVAAPQQPKPISRTYASDYMCCWGKDGKIVVKYVGALKKREIMRSVWVPKTYVTNPLGPKTDWVPKTKA